MHGGPIQSLWLSWLTALCLVGMLQPAQALDPLYPEAESGDPADLARPVLSHPVQDEVLYFLIPDRFHNSDPANDCGAFQGICRAADSQRNVLTHGYLPADRGYYHGGDLKGLLAKLDYLKDMGVTAIWVGPIFKNKPVQRDATNRYGHSSAYHGYWITDFMSVDPHLGSNEDFKHLIQAAHDRGIRVFMDIITNHTADVIQYGENQYSYRSKEAYPYRSIHGESFDDAEYAYRDQEGYAFPEMDLGGFPYTPTVAEAERDIKNPAWLNDPLLYHNRGDTTFTGENSLYGDFFGLDDLFTERKDVVEGMIEIYTFWIQEFKPDGFRIDTTKHVNLAFWQVFGPAIVAAAQQAGIEHFFAFGEVYNTQPEVLSLFSTGGRLQSTIDFGFQAAAREFASQGQASDRLGAFFEQDDYYTDADSNAYAMPVFLGNHDMGRIGYFLEREDQRDADGEELLARSILANGLMFFSRGQPVIYYGDEQGFVGDGGDKLARQDMFPSRVPEYNDDSLIGTDATTAADNFDPGHPLYRAIKEQAELYHAHPALRSGAQIHRYSTSEAGIYAFSRIHRDEKVEYVVALNNSEHARTVTVPTFYPQDSTFKLLLAENGQGEAELITAADGSLSLAAPPLGLVVYRAADPAPVSAEAPGIAITQPQTGATVALLEGARDGHPYLQPLELRAELDRAIPAEVTFAVKVDDGPYRIIGTDNNPPYRVFYRLSAEDAESKFTFKAVVDDLSGHLNAALVEAVGVTFATPELPHPQAVIHYLRADGDYGNPESGDFNDYWGLHIWGESLAPGQEPSWTEPRRFESRDACGPYTVIELQDDTQPVHFIVHRGNTKDGTDQDRRFYPRTDAPEVWLKQDDAAVYTEPPAGCPRALKPAGEAVTFRYRPSLGQSVHRVSLRGTMNEWGETPMERQADGSWVVTLELTPGEYAYKYFINGEWPQNMEAGQDGSPVDGDADGYANDGFGGQNAVRQVGE